MLGETTRYLQSRRTHRMVCEVLRENVATRAMAVSHGFRIQPSMHAGPSLFYAFDLAIR